MVNLNNEFTDKNSKNFAIQKRVAKCQMFSFAIGENSVSRGIKNKYIK